MCSTDVFRFDANQRVINLAFFCSALLLLQWSVKVCSIGFRLLKKCQMWFRQETAVSNRICQQALCYLFRQEAISPPSNSFATHARTHAYYTFRLMFMFPVPPSPPPSPTFLHPRPGRGGNSSGVPGIPLYSVIFKSAVPAWNYFVKQFINLKTGLSVLHPIISSFTILLNFTTQFY